MAHQEQNSSAGYVVRLAETADALMAILKVRYEVMRVEFPMYVAENPIGIDIDQWDTQAHHLGLWKIADGREEPVGYMRIIQTSPTTAGEEVFKIVKMFPTLEDRIKRTSNNPIKFLDKYHDFKEARIKYDGFSNEKMSTMREEFKRRREIVFKTQIQEACAYRTQVANKAPIE